jgi:hypothetical protein
MSFVANTAKKIAFWNYSRTSWQWDVLCVLILVFIFLTPKSWQTHVEQTTVAVGVDVVGNQLDRAELERRARLRAKRPTGEVGAVREVTDANGKLVAYEIDIR